MKVNMEERLPQVVEDRLKEAYEQIRRGEIKQMNKVTDPDWEASRKERKTDGRKRKTGIVTYDRNDLFYRDTCQ